MHFVVVAVDVFVIVVEARFGFVVVVVFVIVVEAGFGYFFGESNRGEGGENEKRENGGAHKSALL